MYTSLTLLSLLSTRAYAWGTLGHETVAYIATGLVKSNTKAWAQSILGDTSPSYLANIATWADTYRYTAAGKFSAGFHFIDSEDDPPNSCNVDYERDCHATEGCIVSAIANYTQRVQQPSVLPALEVNYALRWLVHFLGDITQPLHVEAIEVGGNKINTTFDGEEWNLHSLWDTGIPEKIRGIETVKLSDAQAWAADLTNDIKTGKYKAHAQTWIQGDNIATAKNSALAWARDSNLYVCSSVFPDSVAAVSTVDLGGDYYDQAAETVEMQIAKGGYRLAHWLDLLAAAAQKNNAVYERSMEPTLDVDLSGRDLLPAPRELSAIKLARRAFGSLCDHAH